MKGLKTVGAVAVLSVCCMWGVASAGTTELVSKNLGGSFPNSYSRIPSASSDGRYVAFSSPASDIALNDYDDEDVFIVDRQNGTTRRVSAGLGYSWWPTLSADGQKVSFEGGPNVNIYDAQSETIQPVVPAIPGLTYTGGRWGNFSRGGSTVFMEAGYQEETYARTVAYNINTGAVTVVASNGESLNGRSVSPDGNFLAFFSSYPHDPAYPTSNGYYLMDQQSGETKLISKTLSGLPAVITDSTYTSVSAGGRFVVFAANDANLVPGDTNGVTDIFIYDSQSGAIELVSVGPGGSQANGSSFLGYSQLVVSNDGRYVAFASNASNLVSVDTNGMADIFVRDRLLGVTERVSVSSIGTEACGNTVGISTTAVDPALTEDGRFVTFTAGGWNLSLGNGPATPGYGHVYIHDRLSNVPGITANIDVATGSIKLTSHKKFEVRVFSTQNFDATQIELGSAKFANAQATEKITGDFNGDGSIDVTFTFYPTDIIMDTACNQGIFEGTMAGSGVKVAGYDSVTFNR